MNRAPRACPVCAETPRNVKDQGVWALDDEAEDKFPLSLPIQPKSLGIRLLLRRQDSVHSLAEFHARHWLEQDIGHAAVLSQVSGGLSLPGDDQHRDVRRIRLALQAFQQLLHWQIRQPQVEQDNVRAVYGLIEGRLRIGREDRDVSGLSQGSCHLPGHQSIIFHD